MIETGENNKILHQPKLDTIRMVEQYVEAHSGDFKKRALWEHLPKKMMYQTYQVIFDYLVESGKIAVDAEGNVCWVWNPELVKKYLGNPDLIIK